MGYYITQGAKVSKQHFTHKVDKKNIGRIPKFPILRVDFPIALLQEVQKNFRPLILLSQQSRKVLKMTQSNPNCWKILNVDAFNIVVIAVISQFT